ncbi:hypothetical protein [Lentibacillus sp.]|uniref:hypothetical protein n=1 Tax=Lentibacillus sp. TaxID=1925746 RepID=UPI002B4AC7C1|nr:hypothetical protein [Lentibacillus sp.]HLS08072.1 hypothetical protein [Lentibacillus sp.]
MMTLFYLGEYKSIHPGQSYKGSFTGKSVLNGGSLGRKDATGKGVDFRYMLHDFAKDQEKWLSERDNKFAETLLDHINQTLSIAVQGSAMLVRRQHLVTYIRSGRIVLFKQL